MRKALLPRCSRLTFKKASHHTPNLNRLGDGTSADGFGAVSGEVLDLCGSLRCIELLGGLRLGDGTSAGGFGAVSDEVLDLCGSLRCIELLGGLRLGDGTSAGGFGSVSELLGVVDPICVVALATGTMTVDINRTDKLERRKRFMVQPLR